MTKKPDEMNEYSLKKGLSNLGEHENLPDRLRNIEREMKMLSKSSWINFIMLLIIFASIMFFGGVLP